MNHFDLEISLSCGQFGPHWSSLVPTNTPTVIIVQGAGSIRHSQGRQALQYKSVPSQLYNQRSHDTWEHSAGAT